jgi:hypothetical protein
MAPGCSRREQSKKGGCKKEWCERRELNPHGLAPGGFSYPLQLSLPARRARFVVWTIPSPYRKTCLQLRCCPSSLYTFLIETNSDQAWLGIAILKVSPTLSSSTSAVSRTRTQVWFESTASAIPPRSHCWFTYIRQICFLFSFYSSFFLGGFYFILMKYHTASGGCSRGLIITLLTLLRVPTAGTDLPEKTHVLSPARLPFHHSGTRAFIDSQHSGGIQEAGKARVSAES